MIIDNKKNYWDEFSFETSRDLETFFEENYRALLGQKTLLFTGDTTSPHSSDKFVVDLQNNKWILIGAELSKNSIYQNIVPQMTKQLRSADPTFNRSALVQRFTASVKANADYQKVFRDMGFSEDEIQKSLERVLDQKPQIAISVDRTNSDLEAWVSTLQYQVQFFKVTRFKCRGSNDFFYSIPDSTSEHFQTHSPVHVQAQSQVPTPAPVHTPVVTASKPVAPTMPRPTEESDFFDVPREGAPLLRAMVNSSFLKNGQTLTMFYMGRPFRAIVGESGHLVLPSGDKHLPDAAAVKCIQTVTPSHSNENGWLLWKTSDGRTLDQIRQEFYKSKSKVA